LTLLLSDRNIRVKGTVSRNISHVLLNSFLKIALNALLIMVLVFKYLFPGYLKSNRLIYTSMKTFTSMPESSRCTQVKTLLV
jgi:hypothetical protein